MLKKLPLISIGALLTVTGLIAADAWTKPYTEWSDKDRQKVAEDSPWGDRRNRGTGDQNQQGSVDVSVRLMWVTALPIKQMLYGKAAETDPAAKARLEREEQLHVMQVEGLPSKLREMAEDKEAMIAATVLKVKDKGDIHPIDVQVPAPVAPKGFGPAGGGAPAGGDAPAGGGGGFGGGGGRGGGRGGGGGGGFGNNLNIIYVFAKDAPITTDDKEFEFQTKIGKMEIHRKYKTQDMVYNGKLEW